MTGEQESVRRLAAALRENLVKCGSDPDVDPVHDTRTGTRRLQATMEILVREAAPDEAGERLRRAAATAMRLLKKIRRTAGPVRDLDVHRKLLGKLTKRALGEKSRKEKEQPDTGASKGAGLAGEPDVLETPEAGLRIAGLAGQADELDAWLKDQRSKNAQAMQAKAPGLAAKLDKRVAELEEAMREQGRRPRKKAPGTVALDSFAGLATEMQHLHAGNLHDFRKGAKKARYVAELAEGDAQASAVGETLKKLQDEIGDWHDWMVLAQEARTALGDEAEELTALLEGEREKHFVAAMKTAAKLRGRLMGEWLAVSGEATAGQRRAAAARRSW